MQKNLYFFIGTTAELIKVFPVMKEMHESGISYKVISSGQNNIKDSELLELTGSTRLDFILSEGPGKQSAISLLSWFISTLFRSFKHLRAELMSVDRANSYMIVHGDTVSTVMGALIAKKFKLRVAHIEAGLRSFNYFHPFPEEIDRVIVSRLADVSFCPNEWAIGNLGEKGGEKINTFQNTLIDSLAIATKTQQKLNKDFPKSPYFIFVMHRQENLFNEVLVKSLLIKMHDLAESIHCVFILHEPTKIRLSQLGELERLEKNRNITLLPRQPYIAFMQLLNRCEFIITDGGSNQEESYYLGKPSLILRKKTERIEGVGENVVISNLEDVVIAKFISNPGEYRRAEVKTVVSPSKIISDWLGRKVYGKR